MIYTAKTQKAIELAYRAHQGQVDKAGWPYIFHPYHVAEQMTTEDTVVAALLHDVVEDTSYTLEDIAAMGFGAPVVEALALLTHDKDRPYAAYIDRIKDNPIARAVKIADLQHNCDTSRCPDNARMRAKRETCYLPALAVLSAMQ